MKVTVKISVLKMHFAKILNREREEKVKMSNWENDYLCAYPRCENPKTTRGYCQSHYYKLMETNFFGGKEKCSFSGCEKYEVVKGLCRNHYQQARRKGELESKPLVPCDNFFECFRETRAEDGLCQQCRPKPLCSEEGCNREAVARGACKTHYQRKRRRGWYEADRKEEERFYQEKAVRRGLVVQEEEENE